MKYFGKNVAWNGYVVRVNLNDEHLLVFRLRLAEATSIIAKTEKTIQV